MFLAASNVIAGLLYGVYFLFSRKRASNGWPKSYFMLLWFIIGASVVMPYVEKSKNTGSTQEAQTQEPAAKPYSEIDDALKNAPAYQPTR